MTKAYRQTKPAKLDPIKLTGTPEATIAVLAEMFHSTWKRNPNVPDKAIAALMCLVAEGCDALVATGVVPVGVWR